MLDDTARSLKQLEAESGVPERQIRELIRLQILPPPSSSGRGATYGSDHLDRLRAWKLLREHAPVGTTSAQLKTLIDHLAENRALLRGVIDGSIPFKLVDDQREAATVAFAADPRRLAPDRPAASPPPPPGPESPPVEKNVPALEYLARLRATGKRLAATPATSTVPPEAPAPLQLGVNLAPRSAARIPLHRLQASLVAWVDAHATGVRTRPTPSETWHTVKVGTDLTISARGPLAPEDVALLETVGELLQRAIYRTESST